MSVENIDQNKCIGCGTCESTCPMDVLRLDNTTGKAQIKYLKDCQVCHLCTFYCPADAITVGSEKKYPPVMSWG